MVEIEDKLISETIFTEYFICDISRCKGRCCEQGDAGAPIAEEERYEVNKAYPHIKDQITPVALQEINQQGTYINHAQFGDITPTIGSGMCVYGRKDNNGHIDCLFQQAFHQKKIDWEKPISCHLYPIKITKTATYELLNFEPRNQLCKPACKLGEEKKVKPYEFLKTPLIRKYGLLFFDAMVSIDKTYFSTIKL